MREEWLAMPPWASAVSLQAEMHLKGRGISLLVGRSMPLENLVLLFPTAVFGSWVGGALNRRSVCLVKLYYTVMQIVVLQNLVGCHLQWEL